MALPVLLLLLYTTPYAVRARTLRARNRPIERRRAVSFGAGIACLLLAGVAGRDDGRRLSAHMAEHVLLGDVAPLLLVLGCSGPMLAPVLRFPALRRLSHPVTALAVWAADLYAWHLPGVYDAAATHGVLHAVQHACFLLCGANLWFSLLGPLPKPRWFGTGPQLGFVTAWWMLGSAVGAVLVFAAGPVYARYPDAADQSTAGALMMVEQATLAVVVFSALFLRVFAEARTA